MTLTHEEFLRRFVQHIIPSGFMRIMIPEKMDKIGFNEFLDLFEKIEIPEEEIEGYLNVLDFVFEKIAKNGVVAKEVEIYTRLGDMYYNANNFKVAIRYYNQAIDFRFVNKEGKYYKKVKNTIQSILDNNSSDETAIKNRESGFKEIQKYLRTYEIAGSRWTEDLGEMNWNDAMKLANDLGMRLLNIEEFKKVYNDDATKSWEKNWYWTSEEVSSASAYDFFIVTGVSYDYDKVNVLHVRCIYRLWA